jgi:hypothetical protein
MKSRKLSQRSNILDKSKLPINFSFQNDSKKENSILKTKIVNDVDLRTISSEKLPRLTPARSRKKKNQDKRDSCLSDLNAQPSTKRQSWVMEKCLLIIKIFILMNKRKLKKDEI